MKNRWGAGAITFFLCLFLRISICFALVLMDVVQFYASWKVYRFVFYLKLLKDWFFFCLSALSGRLCAYINCFHFGLQWMKELQDFKRAKKCFYP